MVTWFLKKTRAGGGHGGSYSYLRTWTVSWRFAKQLRATRDGGIMRTLKLNRGILLVSIRRFCAVFAFGSEDCLYSYFRTSSVVRTFSPPCRVRVWDLGSRAAPPPLHPSIGPIYLSIYTYIYIYIWLYIYIYIYIWLYIYIYIYIQREREGERER